MIKIFYYDKKLKTLEFSAVNLRKIKNKPVWIDVENATKEHFKVLQEHYNLHPLTVEDLHSKPTHVKIEEFSNYLLVVLKGIDSEDSIKLTEVDFVIGKNFIISNHHGPRTAMQQLMDNEEKLSKLLKKGVDFVLHRLIDVEVDHYLPILEQFDDRIQKLEEEAINKPQPSILQKILKLKRKLGEIKKSSFPQREMIGLLARREYKYISKKAEAYFRDVYDHALHTSNTITDQREAINGAFDAYMSSLSNNMNEVMKMLSIIATIMLPLTFITGIYGMNFVFLPASKHPFGFWAVIIFMTLLATFMLILFRRRRWV